MCNVSSHLLEIQCTNEECGLLDHIEVCVASQQLVLVATRNRKSSKKQCHFLLNIMLGGSL